MNDKLKLASTPPNQLFRDTGFWLSQWDFFLRAIIAVVLAAAVFAATYPQSGRVLDIRIAWLSNLFHILTVWGVIASLRILARIKVEHALADYVDEKAANLLRDIKSGLKNRINLGRVEPDLLPDNEDEELGMMRIFKQIVKEAKVRKFDSSTNLMESYREECIGDIFKLQAVQKVALQLGILGTFIGLMIALEKISLASAGQIVAQLSSALKISFGTSIAGLEVSVILWLFIMNIRRKQEAFFKSMENATITMVTLAMNAVNDDNDEFIQELSQVKRYMEDLGNRIYDQSVNIKAQTEELHKGMTQLAEAKTHFDEFIGQISNAQESFVHEITTVYEVFSPTRVSSLMNENLNRAVNSITDAFKTNMGQASGELVNLNSSLTQLNEAMGNVQNRMQNQAEQMETNTSEIHKAKTDFYNSVETVTRTQSLFVDELKKNLDEGQITKLNRELETFNQAVQKMNRRNLAVRIRFFFQGIFAKLLGRPEKVLANPELKNDPL